jgi:YhcH/YjgK/YiaL family protein
MIIDQINNSPMYYAVNKNFKRAFEYIRQSGTETLAVGRYEIDGEKMFVLVQQYDTKPKEQGVWEAHRRYIDLQYIARGAEGMGYASIQHLQQGEYDPQRDFLPLHGDGNVLTLHSGSFMLLFPQDGHMPGLLVDAPAAVRKIVVKIAIE